MRFGGICIFRCRINEEWTGSKCQCLLNYAYINFVCDICPINSKPSSLRDKCICDSPYIWNNVSSTCEKTTSVLQCGLNFILNSDKTKCICIDGYTLDSLTNKCKQSINAPTCPLNSVWNQSKLVCVCTKTDEFLIQNTCQKCGINSAWNGQQCICRTGYFLINNICRTCDLNSAYNGSDCICNFGFYGNRDKCSQCMANCGKCDGPQINQCTMCIDISYNLLNGKCTKSTSCPTGSYQSATSSLCLPCSTYCS